MTVGPVCSMADLIDHPFVPGAARSSSTVEDRDMGSLPDAQHRAAPVRRAPADFARPAPRLGEHTQEILAELDRLA